MYLLGSLVSAPLTELGGSCYRNQLWDSCIRDFFSTPQSRIWV